MTEYRKHEIVTGLFILAAVGVVILFAFKVGSFDLTQYVGGASFRCEAYFRDIASLEEGTQVVVGGRQVGRVSGIDLLPVERMSDHPDEEGKIRPMIRVTFDVEDPNVVINPANATVMLAQDGLLGTHYLALDAGYWEGDARPVANTESDSPMVIPVTKAPGMEAMMEEASALLSDLRSTIAYLNTQMKTPEPNDATGSIVINTRETLKQSKDLLARPNALSQSDHPEGLYVKVINPLESLIKTTEEELTALTDRLQKSTLVEAETFLKDGQSALKDAQAAVTEARKTLDEGNPKIQKILTNLEKTTGELDGYLTSLNKDMTKLLADADALVVNTDDALDENRADIRETIRRLRRTMWQAEMAFRKVRGNPAYLLFGDDETDLEALTSDEADYRFSGRAAPYEQRDEGDKPAEGAKKK